MVSGGAKGVGDGKNKKMELEGEVESRPKQESIVAHVSRNLR
jgi:hypothetical protein